MWRHRKIKIPKIDRYGVRFNGGNMKLFLTHGGEWVKYDDHQEAMREATALVNAALDKCGDK